MSRKLNEIAEIRTGFQFRKKAEPAPNGDWRVIHIKDFENAEVISWENLDRFDLDTDTDRYRVGSSDVIFLFRGLRQFAYAIDRDEPDVLVSGHFYIIRLNTRDILPAYMPYIPKQTFGEFEVPIPPLDTQTKIVELDKLQQHENSLTAQIQERRKTLLEAVSLRAINQVSTNPVAQ